MSTHKGPRSGIAETAKVFSAFVQAFSKALLAGKSHHLAVVAKLSETPEGVTRFWAKNARLQLEEGILLLLDEVQAEIRMLDPLTPLIPEKLDSFRFSVQLGRLALGEATLSTLIQRYAFPPGVRSPLFDMSVRLPEGRLELTGRLRLHRFLTIDITLVGAVSVTPDGLLEIRPSEIRSGAIPVGQIMSFLGVELERMVQQSEGAGLRVQGDRILVNPVGLLPAPRSDGHLVHAEITGEHLVLTFDDGTPPNAPPLLEPEAETYIALLGHDLLVGKLIMTDLCAQVAPLDPEARWVELSIPHYRSQLAHGLSKLQFGDEMLIKLPPISALSGGI